MNSVDIIIFDNEQLSITLIESYLKELLFPFNLFKFDEFNPDLININDNPKIVILNINSPESIIFEKLSDYYENKKIKFIAMSYDKSANIQVKSFRAGVNDFLLKPIIKQDFINSVSSIYNDYICDLDLSEKAKVYTAVSNRRGDGKSAFLINLAIEIANISNEKVLLIDFNNSQDNISFLLNANISHNINYYINNLTDDNAQALLSTVAKYKNSSLFIMANNLTSNKTIYFNKDKLISFLKILKHHYKYILIDKTPDENEIEDETIINISDEIFCIVLPFISSFDKIKNILDNYYKNKNIKIILNQYKTEDISKIEQIQSILGREIFWKIPKNYLALNNALKNNQTLQETAIGTDIVNNYIELAKSIVNRN